MPPQRYDERAGSQSTQDTFGASIPANGPVRNLKAGHRRATDWALRAVAG
jgi:hypothetical protein